MAQMVTSIFDSGRAALEQQLNGLYLPNDWKQIQQIINRALTQLIAPKGDFRLSLTVAEDAILQQAIALMNIQQQLLDSAKPVVAAESNPSASATGTSSEPKQPKAAPIVGAAFGGSVGGMLFGTWGAVVGAIAGTAVSIYYHKFLPDVIKREPQPSACSRSSERGEKQRIDPRQLTDIIRSLCERIDNLMATYRQNIEDIRSIYEGKEPVSLSGNYQFLLESIQQVIGASYGVASAKDVERLVERCSQLGESLENYGLQVVGYNDNAAEWFDISFSEQVKTPTVKAPAIMEQNRLVIRGRVILPKA